MTTQSKYERVAELLTERLLAGFRDEIHSIILFGSVARGDATEDSDIDVLIISEAPYETQRKMHRASTEIDLGNEVFTQLAIIAADELENEVSMRSWFSSDIVGQGIVLYDDGTFQRIRSKVLRPVAGVPR